MFESYTTVSIAFEAYNVLQEYVSVLDDTVWGSLLEDRGPLQYAFL